MKASLSADDFIQKQTDTLLIFSVCLVITGLFFAISFILDPFGNHIILGITSLPIIGVGCLVYFIAKEMGNRFT